MNKHTTFQTIARAAALSAAILSPLTAAAQSGSRLCGWHTPTPTGEIGILYEARDNDTYYSRLCDNAIDGAHHSIVRDEYIADLPWVKDRKATCESIGGAFHSSNSPTDMCDKMAAHCAYKVVKNNATDTTTYTQLACGSNWGPLLDDLSNLGSTLAPVFNFLVEIGSAADPTVIVRDVEAAIQSAYGAAQQTLAGAYASTVDLVEEYLDEILEALYRQWAGIFIGQHRSFLTHLHDNMMALDGQGRAALNRITAAAAAGQLDANVRADMKLLAGKLGLAVGAASSIVPSDHLHSSWGVFLGASAAVIGGANENLAVVMNTSGTGPVGLTLSAGGALGLAVEAADSVGIFWQPGEVADSDGGYVGLGVDAELGVGVGVGVSWSIGSGIQSAYDLCPGFSLDFGVGVGASLGAFEGGYTWLEGTLP